MLQSVKELLSGLEERLEEPTARGLARAVSRGLRDGLLGAGDRLPPIRTVAIELGLSPTTVSAAWALLARSGAISTDGRRGTTIATEPGFGSVRYRRALGRNSSFDLDLSTGVPDENLLPDLSRVLRSMTVTATPSSYLDDPVLPELLDVLRPDWPANAAHLTVVDGAMDALDLVCRSVLRLGDRVIVESPCFPPLLDLLEALRVDVVGVPVDDEGLRVEPLATALAGPANGSTDGSRAGSTAATVAVFLQPRAQNPTGASLSAGRAAELAELIRGTNALIIEDDSAGAVAASDAISLGPLLADRTVHIRSFSKSHGPDLRLAAISAPPEVMHEITGRRQLGQGWSSRLLQRILLGLLTDPVSIREVAEAREEYARRRALLVGALADRGVTVNGRDGMNIWVPVADEPAAVLRLASQGIGVTAGAPFAVLPGQSGFVRVTAGLLADRHDQVADALAAAARAGGWPGVLR
jgi:DNA-binding transcriptional MocR family regulator